MKRYSNLYKNICKLENVEDSFREVRKNTNNNRRVFNMKQYRSYYISTVYDIVNNHSSAYTLPDTRPGICITIFFHNTTF